MNNEDLHTGTIISVRGSIVDVQFDNNLPSLSTVLHAGNKNEITIEVLSQPDAHHVRGIALTPTQGLARGMKVLNTNSPLTVPVGRETLGHMFDVFGNSNDDDFDGKKCEQRSVHQQPPSLMKRSTISEVFETGIKAIDVLVPLERGGKAGLFGGAGVGKTVLFTEFIHNMVKNHNIFTYFFQYK